MNFIALEVLRHSKAEGNRVTLPPKQLDREVYEEVDEFLRRLGGKWTGGKTAAHVFPYPIEALFKSAVEAGEMPPKNPTAFFPTPEAVIDQMVELCNAKERLPSIANILEPSAGMGAIADRLRNMSYDRAKEMDGIADTNWCISCIELVDLNRSVLESKGHFVIGNDFFSMIQHPGYDAVFMNPPFAVEGDKNAYMTHIYHAWEMLKPTGFLVSVTPMGWQYRSDAKSQLFLDWLALNGGQWVNLEAGFFKESGTGIPTSIVFIEKNSAPLLEQPCNGYRNYYSYEFGLYADSDYEFCRERDLLVKVDAMVRYSRFKSMCERFRRKCIKEMNVGLYIGDLEIQELYEDFCSAFNLDPHEGRTTLDI